MTLAWLTDLHLDFVSHDGAAALLTRVVRLEPDAVVLTGDLAVGPTLGSWLRIFDQSLARPVYVVLGNHDFYKSSLAEVYQTVRTTVAETTHVTWLHDAPPVLLTPTTALVGVDGWGDGRAGDYNGSGVRLNDFLLIDELTNLSKAGKLTRIQALGEVSAQRLRAQLEQVPADVEEVVVATHVPPLAEAVRYGNGPSSPQWLPFFTCVATGDVLREFAAAQPERRFTVLSGHTHTRADAMLAPNVRVRVGWAEYRSPGVEDVLELS